MVERVDHEEERLVAVYLEGLVDDPLELDRVALDAASGRPLQQRVILQRADLREQCRVAVALKGETTTAGRAGWTPGRPPPVQQPSNGAIPDDTL